MNTDSDAPEVDRLARSMLQLAGHAGDDPSAAAPRPPTSGNWSKAPDFAADPVRAAAVREASRRDRDRYLGSGLVPVDCRFCHAGVAVKKLGPGHTAVQWNAAASQRCAVFAEVRAAGGDSHRHRGCPRLADSIEHAVAEGCLEETCTAPPPGDG